MLSVPYLAELIGLVLKDMTFPHVDRAVPLLLGVAAQESGLRYTRQLGGGPARGFFQMEGHTEKSHWQWLATHPHIEQTMFERCVVSEPNSQALQWNIPYQILMARLHFYIRDPAPLPDRHDLHEQAKRWKTYYNTSAGKGTIEAYCKSWQAVVMPYWTP